MTHSALHRLKNAIALAYEDRTGERSLLLKTLDAFGVGFDS